MKYVLERITPEALTRGETRAIEQALMVRNQGFENIRNSISPRYSWYQQAINWAEGWLESNGY